MNSGFFSAISADSAFFCWVILPALIFCARICDVTLGTVRVIFVTRGYKFWAAVTGFFEVLIWIIVISHVIKNLVNPLSYIAYAAGFATGNYVGILVAEKIALGSVLVRVLFSQDIKSLIDTIRQAGFGVTCFDGIGEYGPIKEIFTVISRRQVASFLAIIKSFDPDAFYVIEEVRTVSRVYPVADKTFEDGSLLGFRPFRKGK